MRNTILGKIITETSSINDLKRQIQTHERLLQQARSPQEARKIQNNIDGLKTQLQQSSGDQKRADLIKDIEGLTGRRLLTYFSIHGGIVDRDARVIEDFLISEDINSLDILVDSPGGLTDASEKMIKICRTRTANESGFDYRTIVINQAKSAATLFALGSKKILLCKTAELGPVDPQIIVYAPNGERIRDSAHQLYYGSERYRKETKKLFRWTHEGDLLLLSKYDPVAMKRAEIAINHTNDIIQKRIYTNKYIKEGYNNDEEKLKEDLKIFIDHETSYSHGRPIYYEDVKGFGYCRNNFIQKFDDYYVKEEKKESHSVAAIEKKLWELAVRSLEVVRQDREPILDNQNKIVGFNKVALKLFESSNGLILTKDIVN